MAYHVRLEKQGERKLVGFRVQCPGDEFIYEIPIASQEIEQRKQEITHLIGPNQQIGAFVAGDMTENEDGYWIGYEVSKYENVPHDMVTLTIPAQTYARRRFKGPNHKIQSAYAELHDWIRNNGYQRLPLTWHLEVYHDWSDPLNLEIDLLDTIKESE